MENPNTTNRPATPAEPARDGLADDKATLAAYEGNLVGAIDDEADRFEAKLAEVEAEVEALPLSSLVHHLQAAAEQISEHAHDCRGDDDCEWSYRFEAAGVYRAARLLRCLGSIESLLCRVSDLRDSSNPALVELGDEAAEMLAKVNGEKEGGAL